MLNEKRAYCRGWSSDPLLNCIAGSGTGLLSKSVQWHKCQMRVASVADVSENIGLTIRFRRTSHMKLSGPWEGHGNSILSHAAPFLLRRRLCPWRTCQLPGLIAPHLPCHKSPTITKIRQRGFFDLFRAKTQPELSRPGSLRMKPQKTRTTVP